MVKKYEITYDKYNNNIEWYLQVLQLAELTDYSDIKGFFVLRPCSIFMWNCIKAFLTEEIEKLGVEEYYFPMLVSKKSIEKEKEHLENFDPELAWITHSGSKKLDEPVALRPTSETIIYPHFANYITSYRDLPLKINQWCNVVRWEVKSPQPFIRGREFLWQEGHTAFLKKEEAEEEAKVILELYRRIYCDLLAVPVISGRKSEAETFGGAEYTLTVEAFVPATGKGVQGATSHHLGTKFAEIFDIKFSDGNSAISTSHVFQNCWGITTRSLGVATMVHSDEVGFVCPPKIAYKQVAIIPCGISKKRQPAEIKELMNYAEKLCKKIKDCGIRVFVDSRDYLTPGDKFNEVDVKGVPFKIRLGFQELSKGTFSLQRRHDFTMAEYSFSENIHDVLESEISKMQREMLEKATKERDGQLFFANNFAELEKHVALKHLVLSPWCDEKNCEKEITRKTSVVENGEVIVTGVKSLCIPFDHQELLNDSKCVNCDTKAKVICLFGRSY